MRARIGAETMLGDRVRVAPEYELPDGSRLSNGVTAG